MQSSFPAAHIIGGWTGNVWNFTIRDGAVKRAALFGLALGERVVRDDILSKFTTTSCAFATRGVTPSGPVLEVVESKGSLVLSAKDGDRMLDVVALRLLAESIVEWNVAFVVPVDPNGRCLTDLDDVFTCQFGFDQDQPRVVAELRSASGIEGDIKPGFRFMFGSAGPSSCLADIKFQLQRRQQQFGNVFGAFHFQCSARGSNLYGTANKEAVVFNSCFPRVPLAGCFSGGEICSLGPKNALKANHLGFTSVYGLLVRERR